MDVAFFVPFVIIIIVCIVVVIVQRLKVVDILSGVTVASGDLVFLMEIVVVCDLSAFILEKFVSIIII